MTSEHKELVEGVYLSANLDLKDIYERYFEPFAQRVRLRLPEEIDDPARIGFALAWYPPDDAFLPYPNIRLVSSVAAGVDSILKCPSLPKDAFVTRIHDEDQADFMAGFAVWHVLWHHRKMYKNVRDASEHIWDRIDFETFTVPRKTTVGILGYGRMGAAVARAVSALGYQVVAAARSTPKSGDEPGIRFETGDGAIDRVASVSNILINVLPLTEQTVDILNARLFALMPKGAALIQIGRGQHLVDDDLDAALETGQLSGASIDVFRKEPLAQDHRWWRDPRILITPHQASDSAPGLVAEQLISALDNIASGRRPKTAIDRAAGY